MTKTEQNRLLAWRLKLLREARIARRSVARTCRHFGISRKTFYKWKSRHRAYGEAGLCDRPRVPLRSPRETPREVISKILYLRQRYHFGPRRIAAYLKRFHQLSLACSTVHRILIRHGMNHLPANLLHLRGGADRLQLLSQPPLPQVPGQCRAALARGSSGRPPARGLLPRGLDAPRLGE